MTDVLKLLTEARPAALDPGRIPEFTAPRARARRWPLAVALFAVAAATVVLVPDRPEPGPARAVLMAAAETAEKSPPGNGRYWYAKSENWQVGGVGVCRHEVWAAGRPQDRSWWMVRTWMRVPNPRPHGFAWICPQGRRWSGTHEAGPQAFEIKAGIHTLGGSVWPVENGGAVSAADLQDLPTDPGDLRDTLGGWTDGSDEAVFAQASDILMYLPASAGARAGLFRMLADMPGVQALGRMTDPLGRPATVVAESSCHDAGCEVTQVMFDEDSAGLLAIRTLVGPKGEERLRQWSALTRSGWTDQAPDLDGVTFP
ncbi:CU044_5270 family protein [Herbidospora sp. RD11066]